MTNDEQTYPFYIKAPIILVGLYLFFYILYILQDAFIPLAFSFILAVLFNPLYKKLLRLKLPPIAAISATLLFGFIILFGVIFILGTQVTQFKEMLPEFLKKSEKIADELQHWLRHSLGISMKSQSELIKNGEEAAKTYLGDLVSSFFSIFSFTVLIPVYVFLILLYKKSFKRFFFEIVENHYAKKVASIQKDVQGTIKSYLVGIIIEMCIVAVLNSVALLILGVQNAILLGVIGAILNIIPYLGGLIAILLPVIVAFVTEDSYTTAILVVGAYTIIQLIDNNFIVPKVVSSKVSVNALVSIVVIILGGSLWGVSGMFLAIPFTAIVKILFDNIEDLKPWGKVLGDVTN